MFKRFSKISLLLGLYLTIIVHILLYQRKASRKQLDQPFSDQPMSTHHSRHEQEYRLPVIYFITPTYLRTTQEVDLTRLSHTLRLVPALHWIVIEDSNRKSDLVANLLRNSHVTYTHLNATNTVLSINADPSDEWQIEHNRLLSKLNDLLDIRKRFDEVLINCSQNLIDNTKGVFKGFDDLLNRNYFQHHQSNTMKQELEMAKTLFNEILIPHCESKIKWKAMGRNWLPVLKTLTTFFKGVPQRNEGIKWLRQHLTRTRRDSVVFFGDDDNTYDLKLFDEMRFTRKVSIWPVGFRGKLTYAGPICKQGKVIGWRTLLSKEKDKRKFRTDMAGFAINGNLLQQNPHALFRNPPPNDNMLESDILEQLHISMEDFEPKANNCEKVYVWHTRTENPVIKDGWYPNAEVDLV